MFPIIPNGSRPRASFQTEPGIPESLSDDEREVLDILANMPHGEAPDPAASHAPANEIEPTFDFTRVIIDSCKRALTDGRNHHLAEAVKLEVILQKVQAIESSLYAPVMQPAPTPLHSAVLANDRYALRQLLESNEHDINAGDSEGRTALMMTALHNHTHCFLELVRRGANTSIKDHNGHAPIDVAAAHSPSIFNLLYASGQTPVTPVGPVEPCVEAYRQNNFLYRQFPTAALRSQLEALRKEVVTHCLQQRR